MWEPQFVYDDAALDDQWKQHTNMFGSLETRDHNFCVPALRVPSFVAEDVKGGWNTIQMGFHDRHTLYSKILSGFTQPHVRCIVGVSCLHPG